MSVTTAQVGIFYKYLLEKNPLGLEVHSLTALPHHSAMNSLPKKTTVTEHVVPKILSICFVKIPLISLKYFLSFSRRLEIPRLCDPCQVPRQTASISLFNNRPKYLPFTFT